MGNSPYTRPGDTSGDSPITEHQAAGGGSGSPAGSDTQVQFNDGGVFGADSGFYYNNGTNRLYVGSRIITDRIESIVATGSSPLIVASTTVVTDLNADLLDGEHASAFEDAGTAASLIATHEADTTTHGITAAAATVLDDATVSAMVDTLGGAAATGNDGLVRKTSPTLVTPALGTPASGVLTNCTGLPPAGLTSAARRQTRLCRIDTPVNGDAFQVCGIPDAATIKVVRHIHVGGTSVTFNIQHRAEATPFTASATKVWSSDKTTSSTSTEETSFDDATVAASIVLTVVIGTVTGSVTNMLVVIEYEAD